MQKADDAVKTGAELWKDSSNILTFILISKIEWLNLFITALSLDALE